MSKVNRHISQIENFLSKLLTKWNVSDSVFVGKKPITVSSSCKSFVYVEVNSVDDYDSHSSCSASIYLYVRPKGRLQEKDLSEFDKVEGNLTDAINGNDNSDYIVYEQWRDSGYDTAINFFFDVVNISITAT